MSQNNSTRFDYVKYDEQATQQQNSFKGNVQHLEAMINQIQCPRSKALALTKLEEVYMWIGKGIRNDQLARNQETVFQEQRTNS